jgi:hypothetical protein
VVAEDVIFTEAELAKRYGKKEETVRDWRKRRKGPDYFKAGCSVMYRQVDVLRWEAEQVKSA